MATKLRTLLAMIAVGVTVTGCSGSSTDKSGPTGPADADGDTYTADVDCDDTNPAIYPGADETCNGVDDNCDGVIDEATAVGAPTWYADTDGDTYGDATVSQVACTAPDGYVTDATDCDDTAAAVNPAADETCDGIDNNCDGTIDESTAVDAATWYLDSDGDGYGNAHKKETACTAPDGYVADSTDCDDSTSGTHPGAWDYCNGIDDNCDGNIDEAAMEGLSFVTVDSNNRAVYEISSADASVTKVADLSGAAAFPISAIATDFFGKAYVDDSNQNRLFSLKSCTGALSRVGFTGVGGFCGMTFSNDGTLYAVDGVNNQLVVLDPSTGAATTTYPITVDGTAIDIKSCGVAYNCSTNQLLMLEQHTKTFYTLDTTSGAATALLTTDVSFPYAALTYDPTDKTWLASTGSKLYRYDLTAGTYSLIGAFPSGITVNSLDLHPTCPVSTDTGGDTGGSDTGG